MKTAATVSLTCGILLMVVSFFWPRMLREYLVEKNVKDVERIVESIGEMHASYTSQEAKTNAREVHRVARGNVDSRLRLQEYGVWISRTLGIILTVVGVGVYLRYRDQSATSPS